MGKKRKLTDRQVDQISDLHQSAAHVQSQTLLMIREDKVGREWLLKIKHAVERMVLMVQALEIANEDQS